MDPTLQFSKLRQNLAVIDMTVRQVRKSAYQTTTHLAAVVLLLIIFVLAAYFFTIPEPGLSQRQSALLADLNSRREYWHTRRPASYRYVVARHCRCAAEYMRPYRVNEFDGRLNVEYLYEHESNSTTDLNSPPNPVGVDDLFETIERAILEADDIEVGYDPGFGYANKVVIVWADSAIENKEEIYVKDFEVIEYD